MITAGSAHRIACALLLLPTLPAATLAAGHMLKSGETWRSTRTVSASGLNGAVRLSGRVSDSQIGPIHIVGAYRAVETFGSDAVIRNLRITQFRANDLEREGIRLRGDVRGVRIEDFDIRMRDTPQTRPHLPEGIAIQSGSGIVIRNGRLSGFRLRPVKGKYPNGDGIAAERAVSGLRIEAVEANDNSDAGFDLKSRGTRLENLIARRNFRNYRFWGEVDAGTLTSVDPRSAHVWAGKGAVVQIRRLVARGSKSVPLLIVDGARRVIIDRCDLALPSGTKLIVGKTAGVDLKLGDGCRIA